MPLKSIRAWLGVGASGQDEYAPLRATLDALDHLEPDRARYLAAFAYLLGRVAHADQHVSTEETRSMEALVDEARMVMNPTRATPIISADAVAAVRLGVRWAFSRA